MSALIDSDQVRKALEKVRKATVEEAVDQALENVPDSAKAELDQLSSQTREDLRLQLLTSLDEKEREAWASVLTMQSSEEMTSN